MISGLCCARPENDADMIPSKALGLLPGILSRRSLLFAAGIFSCIYALTVLASVPFLPDLGLRTLFDSSLRGIAPGFLVASVGDAVPGEGDDVTQVGNLPVRVWPDL